MSLFRVKYLSFFFILISFFSFFNIIYSYYFNLYLNLNTYYFSLGLSGIIGFVFYKLKTDEKKPNIFEKILTVLLGYILTTYTDAKMPLLDSLTTIFSIIATVMVIKKVLENWLYFIVIDIASIYLYFYRDLTQTAILFAVYTIIAIYGYFNWIRVIKKNG